MNPATPLAKLAPPGRGGRVGQGLVFVDETADDRVVAEPAAGFGLPGPERLEAAVVDHPGLVGQLGVAAKDQVGQGAPAQVGGADALPAVAAGQRDAGARSQSMCGGSAATCPGCRPRNG
jgi:hypothetical protein